MEMANTVATPVAAETHSHATQVKSPVACRQIAAAALEHRENIYWRPASGASDTAKGLFLDAPTTKCGKNPQASRTQVAAMECLAEQRSVPREPDPTDSSPQRSPLQRLCGRRSRALSGERIHSSTTSQCRLLAPSGDPGMSTPGLVAYGSTNSSKAQTLKAQCAVRFPTQFFC